MGIFFSTESKSDTEVDQLRRRATESVTGLQNLSNESDTGSATRAALERVRDFMATSGMTPGEFNEMARAAAAAAGQRGQSQKGGRKRSQKGGRKRSRKGGLKKSKKGRKKSKRNNYN
jgi:hypothetical protein